MSALILRQQLVRKSLIHTLHMSLELTQSWIDRYHQRKQLAQLDAEQLKDLGISAEQQRSEVAKPFWR